MAVAVLPSLLSRQLATPPGAAFTSPCSFVVAGSNLQKRVVYGVSLHIRGDTERCELPALVQQVLTAARPIDWSTVGIGKTFFRRQYVRCHYTPISSAHMYVRRTDRYGGLAPDSYHVTAQDAHPAIGSCLSPVEALPDSEGARRSQLLGRNAQIRPPMAVVAAEYVGVIRELTH